MFRCTEIFSSRHKPEWFTVSEAAGIINELTGLKLRDYDIYRYALYGRINLSIYFQSPVFLRKVKLWDNKIKLTPTASSFVNRLCMLDTNCFLNGRNLVISTEGRFLCSSRRVFDTTLIGHEYVQVQYLLARALRLPRPVCGANDINYGITVMSSSGEVFQLFEYITWHEKMKRQVMKLRGNTRSLVNEPLPVQKLSNEYAKEHFPVHHLPPDACFVLRYTELEKLFTASVRKGAPPTPRMSTPLTRLFWLSCKNNEVIRPLINQPYKLLSIFEQWASDEGITVQFSGDTIKTALQRGSPPSVKNNSY